MIDHAGSGVFDAVAARRCVPDADQIKLVLADIFGRLLRRTDIDDKDDFFDLGGDSIIAVSLMEEITRLTGQVLPITILYEAANIASITRLLLEQAKYNASNLVLLKPGQPEIPLFIVHGLGGSVMELRDLARHINTKQMIYGIEARGLEGTSEPFDQVEEMALFYIEQIKRIQPNGPYFLAGYSFGGLVALQMAQNLTASGNKIAFLALIDTYPHAKFWPLVCRLRGLSKLILFQFTAKFWSRLIKHYVSVLGRMSLQQAARFLLKKVWDAVNTPFDLFKLGALTHRFVDTDEIENLTPAPSDIVLPAHLRKVIEASDRAFAAYRPQFYPGEITFFKAESAVRVPFEAKSLWGRMCRAIAIYPVPGNHRNLIIESAKPLAELLSVCVDRAFHRGVQD